jgi:Ca-activated chloride channel homolog
MIPAWLSEWLPAAWTTWLNGVLDPKHWPVGFLWPSMLWLLLAVPLLILAYLMLMRRKRRAAARFANLTMFREAAAAIGHWRRHVPPIAFLLALIAMIGAAARPVAVVNLPTRHETIILAMDISGSMRATDVQPTRLAAAQEAARAFVADQPSSTRIGIVSFAGTASVVQSPTNNREDILGAIERFQTQRGTAIGSAIVIALATIFPNQGIDLELVGERTRERNKGAGKSPPPEQRPWGRQLPRPEFKPVPPGSYTSAAIVLLSDGQRTAGPDTVEAAKLAAERGIKIFTVGIGTVNGTVLGLEGMQMRVKLDEEALKSIANTTHGEYFYAKTATELKKIYQGLNTRFTFERRETEISALFSAAAAIFALLSGVLSMIWFNRIF